MTPGDGPLDEVYDRITDWNPSSSLCVVDWQVAEVQQTGATVTGRRVQRSARIMLVVSSGEADGRLGAVTLPPLCKHPKYQLLYLHSPLFPQ